MFKKDLSVCCDLHTHTTHSDGSFTPSALVQLAEKIGLGAIAITDHDTMTGVDEALAAGKSLGVEVIAGVEMSVIPPSGDMHILAYYADARSSDFASVLELLQAARTERNPMILKKLRELGKPLEISDVEAVAGGAQIGRPHIARAMVNKGYVATTGEAFARYLRKDAPAYVPKSRLMPHEAVDAIHKAGGVAVLAHPISLRCEKDSDFEQVIAGLSDVGLDGMECYYSEHDPLTTRKLLEMAKKYRLITTGGSDFHGIVKPQIALGKGRGMLCVPYSCVAEIRKRHQYLSLCLKK